MDPNQGDGTSDNLNPFESFNSSEEASESKPEVPQKSSEKKKGSKKDDVASNDQQDNNNPFEETPDAKPVVPVTKKKSQKKKGSKKDEGSSINQQDNNNPIEETPDAKPVVPVKRKKSKKKKAKTENNITVNESTATPKPLKRQTNMSFKSVLKRGATISGLSLPKSPSPSKLPVPGSTDKNDPITETDGIKDILKFKTPTKESKQISEANMPVTPSPLRRPKLFRGLSGTSIKRTGNEKKKGKRAESSLASPSVTPSSTFSASTPSEPVASQSENEVDYSGIVVELKNSPQSKIVDDIARPNMKVEFGKADIESAEYRFDQVIKEIECGFFLGPVLR